MVGVLGLVQRLFRQHNVKRPPPVCSRHPLHLADLNDERLLDEVIGLVVRVALEVELGDELLVAVGPDQVVNVAGPPRLGADLVGSGMDGFVLVPAALVGEEAGAVAKDVLGGRRLGVVVVIAALGIGLPDVEQRSEERRVGKECRL